MPDKLVAKHDLRKSRTGQCMQRAAGDRTPRSGHGVISAAGIPRTLTVSQNLLSMAKYSIVSERRNIAHGAVSIPTLPALAHACAHAHECCFCATRPRRGQSLDGA